MHFFAKKSMRRVKENIQIFVSYWHIIGQWHIIGHNLDDLIFCIIIEVLLDEFLNLFSKGV